MEPVLTQKEISELLKAIKAGRIPLEQSGKAGCRDFLECTPLNLFQLVKPNKDQFRIPNLDIILDVFARLFSTSLTNQLQRTFIIQRTALETYEFQQFMSNKTNPGAIGILTMSPLKQGALMIMNPDLSFSLLELMLGASSEVDSPRLTRRLTTIELNILKTVMVDACQDINNSFEQLVELDTQLIKLENNARLVSIVEPESEVIVGTLQVRVGDYTGEMQLVFPFITLEPLKEPLKALLSIKSQAKSNWQTTMEQQIENIPVTLTAHSGSIHTTIRDLLHFRTGDILPLDYDPNAPLKILVEDIPKFLAIPGTNNGNKAIRIISEHKEG